MSKTFCPLPWIHLATRPNGDVRVCCTANASGAGKQDEKTAGLVKKDDAPTPPSMPDNLTNNFKKSAKNRKIEKKKIDTQIQVYGEFR